MSPEQQQQQEDERSAPESDSGALPFPGTPLVPVVGRSDLPTGRRERGTRLVRKFSKLEASSLEGDLEEVPEEKPAAPEAATPPPPPSFAPPPVSHLDTHPELGKLTRKFGRDRERWIENLRKISNAIIRASKEVKVLPSIEWDPELKQEFFEKKERELPRPVYPDRRAELEKAEETLASIRESIKGKNPIDVWLRTTCDSYEVAAKMLAHLGTEDFYKYSRELYGDANTVFVDGVTTNADLAKHLARSLSIYRPAALGSFDAAKIKAVDAAPILQERFTKELPGEDIAVILSDDIASKAIAGPDRVKVRRDALLSVREIEILVVHEGLVHVATTLNGRNQPILRVLGKGAPRTMRIQEGLAVFAEFMSGAIDVDRVRRLADRTIAIEKCSNGADFMDLYKFFRERGDEREEAFDNAQRVVRGGKVDGGAPFTKDVIYLDGLTRINGYLHVAVPRGRLDDVARLFVGKIALEDIPALRELEVEGVIVPPKHMPIWAKDLRFLAAHLAYGTFLKRFDISTLHDYYSSQFAAEDADAWSLPDEE